MSVWQQKLLSLLLYAINMVSQLTLLLFSGWFIAACAISGQAGVLAGFNYMIPAVVIRFLALTRISSGYFEKYLSHLLLLRILKQLRANLLTAIFYKQKNLTQSETGQALQQQTEQLSASWNTITSPIMTGLSVGLAVGFLLLLWWPSLLLSWFILIIAAVILVSLFSVIHKASVSRELRQQQVYLDQQRQWLHVSTLWHFTKSAFSHQRIEQQAMLSSLRRIQVDTIERLAELAITLLSLLFTTSIFYRFVRIDNAAYWVVAFMIFLSIRDWLQPYMQAQFAKNRLAQTSPHLFHLAQPQILPTDIAVAELNLDVESLEFKYFTWQRGARLGPSLTANTGSVGCYMIYGETGIGKSSLFDAMTGELDFQGTLTVNGQQQNISQLEHQGLFHYVQQHEHVFTGTLAENLRISCAQASNEDMINALIWAELPQWASSDKLTLWLGAQGLPISGGEKKRLFLARAYLSKSPVWLLDEPFEGLDDQMTQRLVEKLNKLSESKLVLLVSHLTPNGLAIKQTFTLNDGE